MPHGKNGQVDLKTLFEFQKLNIADSYLIKPISISDERGFMNKFYNKEVFCLNGIEFNPYETMILGSKKNVLRGIHYQIKNAQTKLVYCIKGSIYAVIVDLRKGSTTFEKYEGYELTDKNNKGMLIPPGCGLGSLALKDSCLLILNDGKYYPEYDSGIKWDDPKLCINWGQFININELHISEKDKRWQPL